MEIKDCDVKQLQYVSSRLQRTHFAIQEGPLTAARALLSFSFVLLASIAMESSRRIC
jgi:hypothetical protein